MCTHTGIALGFHIPQALLELLNGRAVSLHLFGSLRCDLLMVA
jgi:hypothetical protein